MEFERSIFRVHERCFQNPLAKRQTLIMLIICLVLTIIASIQFVAYHKMYVNNSEILNEAFESQILLRQKDASYQKMTFNHRKDKFTFCNVDTWSIDDMQGI